MFSSVDMILNDMHIYRGNNLWPYQSHLNDLLTQGSSQKDYQQAFGTLTLSKTTSLLLEIVDILLD
jgi:hypothetical protein